MESTSKLQSILSKFGILCSILPYYGYFKDWEYLLTQLSMTSNEFWRKNKKAFWNLFKFNSMTILMYRK